LYNKCGNMHGVTLKTMRELDISPKGWEFGCQTG